MFLFVFALYHAVFIYLLFFFIINSLRETTRFLFFFFFFPNIFCNLIFIISPSLPPPPLTLLYPCPFFLSFSFSFLFLFYALLARKGIIFILTVFLFNYLSCLSFILFHFSPFLFLLFSFCWDQMKVPFFFPFFSIFYLFIYIFKAKLFPKTSI